MVCTLMVPRQLDFKSMVVAQYHGTIIQKDDRAFVKYNASTGNYDEGGPGAHLDGFAEYKKGWRHTHVMCSNDSFIQVVSVFAVDMQITLLDSKVLTCLLPTVIVTLVILHCVQKDLREQHSLKIKQAHLHISFHLSHLLMLMRSQSTGLTLILREHLQLTLHLLVRVVYLVLDYISMDILTRQHRHRTKFRVM